MTIAEVDCGSYAQRIRLLLGQMMGDPALQARFLNTLSLLEHIGSRKILVSQSRSGSLSGRTLKHLAEETRHAFFFKRAAEAAAGHELGYEDDEVLAGAQARAYMGRLDAFIAQHVSGKSAYLFMSLVIEIRATWFYELYQEVLKSSGQSLKLTSLLAEENGHLAEMREQLAQLVTESEMQLKSFIACEESLFLKLLHGLEESLQGKSDRLEHRAC